MIRDGASIFIETGEGKVLSSLIRKIDKSVKVLHYSEAVSYTHLDYHRDFCSYERSSDRLPDVRKFDSGVRSAGQPFGNGAEGACQPDHYFPRHYSCLSDDGGQVPASADDYDSGNRKMCIRDRAYSTDRFLRKADFYKRIFDMQMRRKLIMADFKRRFKDLLGFGGNESVAYDDSAEDDFDYSDYDETEDTAAEEEEDAFVSSTRYSARNASGTSSRCV